MANPELGAVHDYCISRPTRELWLHGSEITLHSEDDSVEPGIEFMTANRACKNLMLMMHDSRSKPVTLHMHTNGGDWNEGMAIYDTIRLMPYHVKIINYTHARSMSSLIFLAGDERLMMPHSYFMFHMGTWALDGTVKQVRSSIEFGERENNQMLDIYVEALKAKGKYQKKARNTIRSILLDMMDQKEEVYLSAQEAVEWGFADGIVQSL